jgi:hypothetical protein
MLRDFFFTAISNSSTPSPLIGTGVDIDAATETGETLWHLAHCLDYLRQTVVCTMDMTVEFPTLGARGKPPAINGYEIQHVCRRRVSGVFFVSTVVAALCCQVGGGLFPKWGGGCEWHLDG